MATFRPLDRVIEDTVRVGIRTRDTNQELHLLNGKNMYWGTIKGNAELSSGSIANTSLSNVTFFKPTGVSVDMDKLLVLDERVNDLEGNLDTVSNIVIGDVPRWIANAVTSASTDSYRCISSVSTFLSNELTNERETRIAADEYLSGVLISEETLLRKDADSAIYSSVGTISSELNTKIESNSECIRDLYSRISGIVNYKGIVSVGLDYNYTNGFRQMFEDNGFLVTDNLSNGWFYLVSSDLDNHFIEGVKVGNNDCIRIDRDTTVGNLKKSDVVVMDYLDSDVVHKPLLTAVSSYLQDEIDTAMSGIGLNTLSIEETNLKLNGLCTLVDSIGTSVYIMSSSIDGLSDTVLNLSGYYLLCSEFILNFKTSKIDNDKKFLISSDFDMKLGLGSKALYLSCGNNLLSVDCTDFVKDGMLSSVEISVDSEHNETYLVFKWNTDSGILTTSINVKRFAVIYRAGEGLVLDLNTFTFYLDSAYKVSATEFAALLSDVSRFLTGLETEINERTYWDLAISGNVRAEEIERVAQDTLIKLTLGEVSALLRTDINAEVTSRQASDVYLSNLITEISGGADAKIDVVSAAIDTEIGIRKESDIAISNDVKKNFTGIYSQLSNIAQKMNDDEVHLSDCTKAIYDLAIVLSVMVS